MTEDQDVERIGRVVPDEDALAGGQARGVPGVMNENHQRLCGSAEWAAQLQETVLARLCRDVDLGQRMLEIGPGPGAATGWLRSVTMMKSQCWRLDAEGARQPASAMRSRSASGMGSSR